MNQRDFTVDEMVERLSRFVGKPFAIDYFTGEFEAYLPGGEYEDSEGATTLQNYYPNLCKGEFDQNEWQEYVSDTFWSLYDCEILVPNFPRD